MPRHVDEINSTYDDDDEENMNIVASFYHDDDDWNRSVDEENDPDKRTAQTYLTPSEKRLWYRFLFLICFFLLGLFLIRGNPTLHSMYDHVSDDVESQFNPADMDADIIKPHDVKMLPVYDGHFKEAYENLRMESDTIDGDNIDDKKSSIEYGKHIFETANVEPCDNDLTCKKAEDQ